MYTLHIRTKSTQSLATSFHQQHRIIIKDLPASFFSSSSPSVFSSDTAGSLPPASSADPPEGKTGRPPRGTGRPVNPPTDRGDAVDVAVVAESPPSLEEGGTKLLRGLDWASGLFSATVESWVLQKTDAQCRVSESIRDGFIPTAHKRPSPPVQWREVCYRVHQRRRDG